MSDIKFEFIVQNQQVRISRFKIFCIAFIGMFLIVFLKKMGVESPHIGINQTKVQVVAVVKNR